MNKGFWFWVIAWMAFSIAIVALTEPHDGKAESGCTTWIQSPEGTFGQCGPWGVWQHDNTFPWPTSPWLPGRNGIPGSPGYNPGGPYNGPLPR